MATQLLPICGLGVLCAFCALILRGRQGELAVLLRVGGLVLMMGILLLSVRDSLGEMEGILSSSALSTYTGVMLKAIGIAVLCTVCGDICRDCGEGSIASCVEIAGNMLILSLCIPILREILGYASSLLALG